MTFVPHGLRHDTPIFQRAFAHPGPPFPAKVAGKAPAPREKGGERRRGGLHGQEWGRQFRITRSDNVF